MTETDREDLSLERFGAVHEAAELARDIGLPIRDRREKVIATVAEERLDKEPVDVQERAIRKYFEGEIGLPKIHGMVDGLHVQQPGEGEVISILRERLPLRSVEELSQLYRQWFASPKGNEVVSVDPSLAEAMRKIRGKFEEYIRFLVKRSAQGCEGSWFLAKKSRMWADANRRSFFHQPRGTKLSSGELIQTKEYPTAARAALYWVIRRVAERTIGLDGEGKVKAPFLRLALHGMVDSDVADVVLGGGNMKPGKESKPASEKVLRWFAQTLVEKLHARGLQTFGKTDEGRVMREPVVAIQRLGQDQAEVFGREEDGMISSKLIDRTTGALSGGGLGLEHFRTGATFEVEDVSSKKRILKFPGFGDEFHTIQAEVCNSLRMDKASREKLAGIFSEMMVEFSSRFAESGSSLD